MTETAKLQLLPTVRMAALTVSAQEQLHENGRIA